MFPTKELLVRVVEEIQELSEEAKGFEEALLKHEEEPRSCYTPNRGLEQIIKEIVQLKQFKAATEALSCHHDNLRHFCDECRMDEQADAAEYDMKYEYPLLKDDDEEYIADDELETCHDCKKQIRHDQMRHWKCWDFSPQWQGDEPLPICRECWKLPQHQERMKKDREAKEAEADEETARQQAAWDEEHPIP